jgi:hypothetical protein
VKAAFRPLYQISREQTKTATDLSAARRAESQDCVRCAPQPSLRTPLTRCNRKRHAAKLHVSFMTPSDCGCSALNRCALLARAFESPEEAFQAVRCARRSTRPLSGWALVSARSRFREVAAAADMPPSGVAGRGRHDVRTALAPPTAQSSRPTTDWGYMFTVRLLNLYAVSNW